MNNLKSKGFDKNSGYHYFNNCPVNQANGTRLLLRNGNPLRAKKIQVYAKDIYWSCGIPGEIIESPTGRNCPSSPGWGYPNAPQLGIVVFQKINGNNSSQNITSEDENTPDTFNLYKNHDIYININDGLSSPGYSDNSGAFDIYIKVIA